MALTKATNRMIEGALVNALDFGVSASSDDNTTAMQAAIDYSIANGKTLFLPAGIYKVASTLTVARQSSGWDSFALIGEGEAGSAASGDPGNNLTASKTIIEFTSTTLYDILFSLEYDTFFFESVTFKNLTVRQPNNTAAFQQGIAFYLTKETSNYSRKHLWENINCYGFSTFLEMYVPTGNPATSANYIGPVYLDRVHTFGTLRGVDFINITCNLFSVTRCLFHQCTEGGLYARDNSLTYLSVSDTHFEGCSTAIRPGAYESRVSMSNVSAEGCGATNGYGILGVQNTATIGTYEVSHSNQMYGYVLGPDEIRLTMGTRLRSSQPVKASGYFIAETPETIIPVVSDNASYGQSDEFTFFKTELSNKNGRNGIRPFKYIGGFNTSAGDSLNVVSEGLPQVLKPITVGTNNTSVFANSGASAETFTAPSDGYLYASFAADVTDADGIYFVSGTSIKINGSAVGYPSSRKLQSGVGIYTLMYPLSSGDVVSDFKLSLTTSAWRTPAYITFEENLLTAGQAASLLPRSKNDFYTVANSASQVIKDIGGASPTSYAVKVTLLFNGGASGVYELFARGDGLNTNRVYTTGINSVGSGIAITTPTDLNVDLFNISVANTTGSDLDIEAQVEYLS